MRLGLHRAQFEQLGAQAPEPLGQAQGSDEQVLAEQLGDGLAQQVEAFAGLRRQPDAHRLAGVVALDVRLDRG